MIATVRSASLSQQLASQSSAYGDKDEMEMTAESVSIDMPRSCCDSEKPVSLEGVLYIRKGRASGHKSWGWKRRFVLFSFAEGGSIAVYKESPESNGTVGPSHVPTSMLRTVYHRIHPRSCSFSYRDIYKDEGNLEIDIPADLPWIAKDVEGDIGTFVVEIPTTPDSVDLSDSLGHTMYKGDASAPQHENFSDDDIASDDDDDYYCDDSLTIENGQQSEMLNF
jgi:hypothetical protein